MTSFQSRLEGLNPQQKEAVTVVDKPVLVLAGAGSGKTRVLTHKIAYLLETTDLKPWELLAVTFTNKAAAEMRKRVQDSLRRSVDGLWIGTFHSICARILRVEASHLGYDSSYTIYDVDDQVRLLQQIMNEFNIRGKALTPRGVQYVISDAKNRMVDPHRFEQLAHTPQSRQIAPIYKAYQQQLRRNNAMDFDDLMIHPLDIFTRVPEVLEKYQKRFRYVLVDEYQDTNKAQYHLIRKLSEKHQKITVVGDEDQSIYRWRGADIENILNFEKDYPECLVVRLEQNYRSTQNILDAANIVVAHNQKRLGKNLWSDKDGGEKILLCETPDERLEARKAVEIIREARSSADLDYRQMAILYRTNAQSRALEEALRRGNVPYVIVGGTKFYDRKEIKDVLAYLRILVNPRDSVALRRIINFPTRGIGTTSQTQLDNFAEESNIALFDALLKVGACESLAPRTRKSIYDFGKELADFRERAETLPADQLAIDLVRHFGLLRMYENSQAPEDLSRFENIQELLSSIAEFVENNDPENNSLGKYLEEVALLTDIDRWNPDHSAVTLMTLHSAKGLEFPLVILAGMEDGLFPLSRSADTPDDLEEERRLFYVGMTRAMDKLALLWARRRRRFSNNSSMSFMSQPSRFLKEIPGQYLSRQRSTGAGMDFEPRTPARRGRDLKRENPYADMLSVDSPFGIGDWVRHEVFGDGQVLALENSSAGVKLTVIFANKQIKKLVAEYANLEKIEKKG